jgi:hypothetical protein
MTRLLALNRDVYERAMRAMRRIVTASERVAEDPTLAYTDYERVDVTILLATLASALGIHEPGVTHEALALPRPREGPDPDDTVPVNPPTWPDYAWHAPLLIADLLTYAPATLTGYLETTFAEYARKAREELP